MTPKSRHVASTGKAPGDDDARNFGGRGRGAMARKSVAIKQSEERAYDAAATKRTAPLAPWLTGEREGRAALPKRPPGKS